MDEHFSQVFVATMNDILLAKKRRWTFREPYCVRKMRAEERRTRISKKLALVATFEKLDENYRVTLVQVFPFQTNVFFRGTVWAGWNLINGARPIIRAMP